jgi:hypothetical protein
MDHRLVAQDLLYPREFSILVSVQTVRLYGCVLSRIVELRGNRPGWRIFSFPAYGPADCLVDRHGFFVAEFAADTRGTRGPMLRGIAGL